MTDDALAVLTAALAGEASALSAAVDAESLRASAQAVGNLTITPEAVARVLQDYIDGRIDDVTAQRWAFWVRHGVIPGVTSLQFELEIDWPDDDYDDAIATATMRLEELGDIVDGRLHPGEADQLIAALRRPVA